MPRALIVYASSHGQTREVAYRIATRLHARAFNVVVADTGDPVHLPAPAGFDLVIVGSRIQFGRHSSSIIAYLHQYRTQLEATATAFFSVSMAAANGGDDPNGYLAATFERIGWRPPVAAAIAGALKYRRYNFLLRFVMKRIALAAGHSTDTSQDHVYTDWSRVDDFAERTVALCHHEPAQSPRAAN
ncbi:MAG TPA: flavodoxin domain-containing protein [Kofleriaceae bacterium]|nr:flavodoxin domain-containing protein [Kofleriaceae bacterium]